MLQKPDQTAVATAIIGTSSAVAGQYALIILAALFGALVSLSRESSETKLRSGWFIFRSVSIATFTAVPAAGLLSAKLGTPAHDLFACVAFLIAFVGDGWFKIRDWLLLRAKK